MPVYPFDAAAYADGRVAGRQLDLGRVRVRAGLPFLLARPLAVSHVLGERFEQVERTRCDADRVAYTRTPLGRLILRVSAEDYKKSRA